MTIKTKMLIYGLIPFGGIHLLKFMNIDHQEFSILTNEQNSFVKIWKHKIRLKQIDNNKIKYEDEIELYAGILTNFVTKWAKSFYIHRQKRWKIISDEIKTKAQSRV